MDDQYLRSVLKKFKNVITIEEGVLDGGFGSGVASWLTDNNYKGNIKRIGISDRFVVHGNRELLLKEVGLDIDSVSKTIKEFVK